MTPLALANRVTDKFCCTGLKTSSLAQKLANPCCNRRIPYPNNFRTKLGRAKQAVWSSGL
jgi:hypothetical protein